jgi:phosphoglycerate kinase
MAKLTVSDLDVQGRRVLMRVDFNVPLEQGQVANDKRLRAALPTIRDILKRGGKLILMSHLGRPKGKRVAELSLKPCARELEKLLRQPVAFADDCIGPSAEAGVQALAAGEVLLLENLRFHKAETDNDETFARRLAELADVYVNDAFGTAHRAHASTEGVTHFMDRCAMGFLIEKEIAYLGEALDKPKRPFVAILGGAKISGKIDVIDSLLPKVDRLIIGGGMAYTFFKANGLEIGNSLVEPDKIELARSLLDKGGDKLILPVDCMCADRFDFNTRDRLANWLPWPLAPFPQTASVSISDPIPCRFSKASWNMPGPSCGTGPWGYLKSMPPPPAPMPWPGPWPRSRTRAPLP